MTERIFMTGEAGYHNLGDEAMALAAIGRLRQYCPEAQIVATGLDPLGAVLRRQARIVPWPLLPGELPTSYGRRLARKLAAKVRAPHEFLDPAARKMDAIFEQQYRENAKFRSVLGEIEKADFVFDMGHGGLNDVFDPFMLCFLYYLAGRLGKPLFVSGQSIGPLWRQRSISMVCQTLGHAHTVGLRDHKVSYDILVDQVGVDPSRVRLVEVGDDALDLEPEEPDWEAFAPPLVDRLQEGRFFAVQWRSSDYTRQTTVTEALVPLVQAIRRIHETTGLVAVFVPLSWELNAGDVAVAARIHDYLQGEFPFHVIWHLLRPAEAKWLLGRARFGVGMSYHFQVFMLSQGVPTIGLYTNDYYDIKLRGVFAAYEHHANPLSYPEGIQDLEPVDRAIEAAMQWDAVDRKRLLEAVRRARRQWHQAFTRFLGDCGLRE